MEGQEKVKFAVTFQGEFGTVTYIVDAKSKKQAKAKAEINLFTHYPLFTIRKTNIERMNENDEKEL